MSGVAKDDTNPSVPTDETASAAAAEQAGATDVTATPPATVSPPPREEADGKPRRGAAFLRVVSDNDPDFVAAPDSPPQRIGDAIRTTRENAGYTLEHVSRETRVHLSHLRAIEDMTPGLLGAPVYAKGYIRSYARYLGLPEQETLDRFLSECAAILKDPAKPEIAQPATSKARKLPVAVPVLGLLVVGLIAGGAVIFFANGDKPVASTSSQTASTPAASTSAVVAAPAVAPQLRIIALKRGMLEVRSAKGDKYVHRNYNPGEFFIVRVGEGFTVSADDGTAFEWRLGDQSLGLLQATGGPVYTQSADLAAQRQPIAPPPPPVQVVQPSELEVNAPAAAAPVVDAATATPRSPRTTPRSPAQQPANPPAASTNASTTPAPAAATPPPARDPALDAYPDVAPAQ